ncbi:MAG: stage V sporulation protein B [Candidatus Nitrosocaldaceae archaeon]|nr:MAG: stage V sporulation protein B [Candidatus Nitrosocaldaceae archaeon]
MVKSSERLIKSSYFLILDQAANYGLGLLFWLIIANILTTTEVGHIMVILAIMNTILGFSAFGAQTMLSKYISEFVANNNLSAAKYVLKNGVKLGLIVSLSTGAILAIFSNNIAMAYNEPSLAPLIILAAIAFLPSHTVMQSFMGAYNGLHKMKYTAITTTTFQSLKLVIAILLIGFGSMGVMAGFTLGSIIAIIIGLSLFLNKLIKVKSGEVVKGIIKFSGFNYLAIGLNRLTTQVNYILLGVNGFDSAAFFGIAALIAGVAGGLSYPIARALLPTISHELNQGKKFVIINDVLRLMLIVSGLVYIVLFVMPEEILSIFSKDYTVATNTLQTLVIASIMSSLSLFIIYVINGIGKADIVAKTAMIYAPVSIISSIIFIPIMGIEGAALAMLIGSTINIGLYVYHLFQFKELSLSINALTKPTIAIIVVVVIGHLLFSMLNLDTILMLTILIGLYIAIIFATKTTTMAEIRSLIRMIIKVIK